jgi:hypothetical protein
MLHPQLGTHHREDLLGDLGLFPAVEVPVHRLPRREVRRQLSPRTSRAHDVQDRIYDRAARVFLRAATGVDLREQGLDHRPLLVTGVRRVPLRSTRHRLTVDQTDAEDT